MHYLDHKITPTMDNDMVCLSSREEGLAFVDLSSSLIYRYIYVFLCKVPCIA